MLAMTFSAFSAPLVAEETKRPWGRLNKPSFVAPQPDGRDGYLGRYNPWNKKGKYEKPEPRYQADIERKTDRKNNKYRGYNQPPAYQSNIPYGAISPWGGMDYSRGYGNYRMAPYQPLNPDTGVLWSDMWHW